MSGTEEMLEIFIPAIHSHPNAWLPSKTSILIILHLNTSSDGELIISGFHEYPSLWALKNALMTLLV